MLKTIKICNFALSALLIIIINNKYLLANQLNSNIFDKKQGFIATKNHYYLMIGNNNQNDDNRLIANQNIASEIVIKPLRNNIIINNYNESKSDNDEDVNIDLAINLKIASNLIKNSSDDKYQHRINSDENFIKFGTKSSYIEIGSTRSASQKLAVGAKNLLKNKNNFYLGTSGSYINQLQFPQYQNNNQDIARLRLPNFIISDKLPIAYGSYGSFDKIAIATIADKNSNQENIFIYQDFNNKYRAKNLGNNNINGWEDSDKISFYQSLFGDNLKVGVSYSPNNQNSIFSNVNNRNQYYQMNNVISSSLQYNHQLENVDIASSISLESGKYHKLQNITINKNNLLASEYGVMIGYLGFAVAGNVGFWGNSLQDKTGPYSCSNENNGRCLDGKNKFYKLFNNANYSHFAINYRILGLSLGLSRLDSNLQNNIYQANSFIFDYGFKNSHLNLEIIDFNFRSNKNLGNNISQNINIKNSNGVIANIGFLTYF